MTVHENLEMGAFSRHDKGGIAADFDARLRLFPRLRERIGQKAGTLSGGEQQMLAMGRALMAAPKLLLLDEPSMGLAPILVEQIFAIIKTINEQGTTILLVEQNALMALGVAAPRLHPADRRDRPARHGRCPGPEPRRPEGLPRGAIEARAQMQAIRSRFVRRRRPPTGT